IYGAMAEPLLRHESGAGEPAAGDRHAAHILATQADRRRIGLLDLARERLEEFPLAIAGDTGNADDLAGAHLEIDAAQRDREGRCGGLAVVVDPEQILDVRIPYP